MRGKTQLRAPAKGCRKGPSTTTSRLGVEASKAQGSCWAPLGLLRGSPVRPAPGHAATRPPLRNPPGLCLCASSDRILRRLRALHDHRWHKHLGKDLRNKSGSGTRGPPRLGTPSRGSQSVGRPPQQRNLSQQQLCQHFAQKGNFSSAHPCDAADSTPRADPTSPAKELARGRSCWHSP